MHEHQTHQTINWKKYIFAFVVTVLVIGLAVYLSNYFNNRKIQELQNIQENISIDILSSETEYSLLQESACTANISDSVLSPELNSLAEKLEYSEENIKTNHDEVVNLQKEYSLLEIKDYLFMKEMSQRCGQKAIFVLYFYSNSDNCDICTKQGYALTDLRNEYPNLRVYSFDYDLDLSAVKTLISLYKLNGTLPALVIDGKTYNGFMSVDDFEKVIPELQDFSNTTNSSSTSDDMGNTSDSTDQGN